MNNSLKQKSPEIAEVPGLVQEVTTRSDETLDIYHGECQEPESVGGGNFVPKALIESKEWKSLEEFLGSAKKAQSFKNAFFSLCMSPIAADLGKCSAKSVYSQLMRCAELDLVPDGKLATIFVEYNYNKKLDRKVATPALRIMVDGATRILTNMHGVLGITDAVVYENDNFLYTRGDEERIEHIPAPYKERGAPIGCYVIAHYKNGFKKRCYMTIEEIYQRKAVARNASLWEKWPDRMVRKTVIHRMLKEIGDPRALQASQVMDDEYCLGKDVTPSRSVDNLKLRENLKIAHD